MSTRPTRPIDEVADAIDWNTVIGCDPDDFCDRFYSERPSWLVGSTISSWDARFLFKEALRARTSGAVEVGTASGFSTALLCHALSFSSAAGLVNGDYRVVTYDTAAQFYLDATKNVGDAARERLTQELLEHVTFRTRTTAADVRQDFRRDELSFLFIDANHKHPWPTLDLLAVLDSLCPGATVVFHDINLPLRLPAFDVWGAKYVFDELDVRKHASDDPKVPNIGSIVIPEEKDQIREQLLRTLFGHPWEVDIAETIVTRALT